MENLMKAIDKIIGKHSTIVAYMITITIAVKMVQITTRSFLGLLKNKKTN